MKVLQECLKGFADFDEMQKSLRDGKNIAVSGCVDSQKVHMIWGLSQDFPYRVIATYSEKRARELHEDFSFYNKDVLYFPAKDFIFFQAAEWQNRRCEVFSCRILPDRGTQIFAIPNQLRMFF